VSGDVATAGTHAPGPEGQQQQEVPAHKLSDTGSAEGGGADAHDDAGAHTQGGKAAASGDVAAAAAAEAVPDSVPPKE
jgi:hypothetical protein